MLVVYPMIYKVLASSQLVGLGISEPSTVFHLKFLSFPVACASSAVQASALQQFCDPGESMMAYAWATQAARWVGKPVGIRFQRWSR